MKAKTWKRSIALLSALAICFALVSCGKADKPAQTGTSGEGKLFTEPTEISIFIASHRSWPYNADWKIWKYFQEATGATFNLVVVPDTETSTKITLMMADKSSMTDLLHLWGDKRHVDRYASSGAFIALNENEDKLPNYTAFWNTFPEEERREIMSMRMANDGNVYCAPVYGTHTVFNRRGWMYRKDIFDKHGLKVPETYEELYQTAKKLKELYPESYPICIRNGLDQLKLTGPSWKKYFVHEPYFDFDANTWQIGATEPIMLDIINYYKKLQQEKLVPPDYLTIATKQWEELMSTDRGFITIDYLVRIDFFNIPMRQQNPEYTLALMPPPKPDVPNAQQMMRRTAPDFSGYTVLNTGKQKNIDNALKLLDWMYTDKGSDLLSWGKAGETYEVVDGKRKFILKDGESPSLAYGIASYGTYQRIALEAYEATYTEEQVAACREVEQYLPLKLNPLEWVPFSEEDDARQNEILPELQAYINEGLSKFLLGQTSLSEYDSFIKNVKEMGGDEMLEILERSYNNVLKAMEQ
ncbi:MAG: extracellular solute-binding protein [Clostridiales bacterium]|nr:extracellular solute-binding protein [Clostridiales bacterium]